MPWRVFPSGQNPTAEVIQKYLMNQVVIVCTSTTRPGTPVEGMVIFEADTRSFLVWIGGSWDRFANSNDWDASGNLTVTGNLAVSGNETITGVLTVSGNDVTIGGFSVNRLVDGKVVAASSNTGDITARTAIPGANAQNVSVIAGRAYRASGFVSAYGSVAGDRFSLELWNGTVGTTQLGGSVIHRITATGGIYQSWPFTFLWQAPTTESIANLNLSVVRLSGTGTIRAQTDGNYLMVVEHLGLASHISGL